MAAIPRPWDFDGQTLEQWMTAQRQRDPNYQVPNGWQVNDRGDVERERRAWLLRNPWMFPLMGIGAGMGLSALGVGAPSGAGGTMAAEGVAPFSGLPGGIPASAGGSSLGPTTATALTASGFNVPDLLKLITAGGLGVMGATQDRGMPPELNQLLDLQRQRLEASNPLYESVLRLAFSRLPTSATQGLPTPQMPMRPER